LTQNRVLRKDLQKDRQLKKEDRKDEKNPKISIESREGKQKN